LSRIDRLAWLDLNPNHGWIDDGTAFSLAPERSVGAAANMPILHRGKQFNLEVVARAIEHLLG
jgi:hypothetical protein